MPIMHMLGCQSSLTSMFQMDALKWPWSRACQQLDHPWFMVHLPIYFLLRCLQGVLHLQVCSLPASLAIHSLQPWVRIRLPRGLQWSWVMIWGRKQPRGWRLVISKTATLRHLQGLERSISLQLLWRKKVLILVLLRKKAMALKPLPPTTQKELGGPQG